MCVLQVLNVAEAKSRNSALGHQFLRFGIFLAMYIFIVYNQRNGYESECINTSMRQHLVESSYRDPSSLDPKTFTDITTVDDFWNWHEHVLLPRLLKETPDAPGWSQFEPYTLLQHNYLVGSFRMTLIRAQQRKCELKDKYQVICLPIECVLLL